LDWQPEVAVVDIGLPVLDGYQVARQVRAALQDRIVLIALTAFSQAEDRRRAHEAGFDVHLSKPADLAGLARSLAREGARPLVFPPLPSEERGEEVRRRA